jgi:hypothetical protein
LHLNDTTNLFKEFYGSPIELMPKLIGEGRIPMSVANIVKRRIEDLNAGVSQKVIDAWWDNYFDTGDAILYHPNGNIKIVLSCHFMRKISPETKLESGGMVLGSTKKSSIKFYNSIEGVEFEKLSFRRHVLEGDVNRALTADEVKTHPIWMSLVPDKALLNEYVDVSFTLLREKYDEDEMMGVYLDYSVDMSHTKPPELAVGRLWCIDDLCNFFSNLRGNLNLDSNYDPCRFIGVKKE